MQFLQSPIKALAVKLRSLGDTVLLTGVVRVLHHSLQKFQNEVNIDVVVPAIWSPLLRFHPSIRKIWEFPSSPTRSKRLVNFLRLIPPLRREKYHLVLNFHASNLSSLFSLLSGAKFRANHFHGHHAVNRFSTLAIPGKGQAKSALEKDLDILKAFHFDTESESSPKIFLQQEEVHAAKKFLADLNIRYPILSLALGASRPTKIWPLGNFAYVLRQWIRNKGGSVLVFEGPDEMNLMKELKQNLSSTDLSFSSENIKFLRISDLRKFAMLLSLSSIFLGNDSGPKHLAAAVGTPTVTLFGPEDPMEWHPYPRNVHDYFFIDGLACRKSANPGMPPWCGLEECTQFANRCMTELYPEPVLKRCFEMMKPNSLFGTS